MSLSECLKCGLCCKDIFIGDGLFDSDNPVDKDCALFITKHWEVIKTYPDGSYYKCTLLNEETNQCTDYDHRPYTCSGFPLYGRDKVSEAELKKYPLCGLMKRGEKEMGNTVKIRQGYMDGEDFLEINGVKVLTQGYTIQVEPGDVPMLTMTIPIEINAELLTAIDANIISLTPKGEETKKEFEEVDDT